MFGFVFGDQQFYEFALQVLLVLEVVENQGRMDIKVLCNFSDGTAFKPFSIKTR